MKKIFLKLPYDIGNKYGGMEFLARSVKDVLKVNGYNVTLIHSSSSKVNKHSVVVIFNIFSINNFFFIFFIWLKNLLFNRNVKLIYFPLWHDPKMQGYYERSISGVLRTLLRQLFNKTIVKIQALLVDVIIVYSEYESQQFNNRKKLSIAGPCNAKVNNGVIRPKSERTFDGVFVGRLAKNKGFERFIELSKILPCYNFALVTSDEIRHDLPKNISIFRSVSDSKKISVISDSKCLYQPSSYESFSIVCLEAINLGCTPVISSNVMGKSYFKELTRLFIFDLDNPPEMDAELFKQAIQCDFERKSFYSDDVFETSILGAINEKK